MLAKYSMSELVRGLCQECGKFNMLEMFEKRGSDIFCCKRGRVTLCAMKILQQVMFVTEGKGEEVKLVVSGEEAEMSLGCSMQHQAVHSGQGGEGHRGEQGQEVERSSG
jgi:hypothetical protein